MKVFILTTVMAPYRVQLFSEIGEKCELHVCFEQMRSSERNDKWYDESSANFRLVELKKWNASVDTTKFDVIKRIREIKPDVVIAYEYSTKTSLVLMSYCQLMKIPYIINCDGAFISKSAKDIVKKWFISRASGFISSGKMADDYLLHYGANEKLIFRNHFTSLHERDVLKFSPTKEDKERIRREIEFTEKHMILSVGQFVHRKGYDILLKAATSLPEGVGVYIVGGKVVPEYIKMVEELNLKNIHFVDFMSPNELRSYYLAADLFVLPTREDVWGLVVNEAMACGLPIVTTDRCIAGIEMIEDGVNGYLAPVENHEMLSLAINKILSNETLRDNMADQNIDRIKKYTYETSALEIMFAIDSVYNSFNKQFGC